MRRQSFFFVISISSSILVSVISASLTYGQESYEIKARESAEKFLLSKAGAVKGPEYQVSLSEIYRSPDTVATSLRFFANQPGGFVIVARVNNEPIVAAWSASGSLDTTFSNKGLQLIRSYYEGARSYIPPSVSSGSKGSKSAVPPLLDIESIKWGQGTLFNGECPWDATENLHAPVGCVATAMGQIMRYYKFPSKGKGSHSYTSRYGVLSADFENTTYQWSSMPGEPATPNSAIAKLLYHCGVAVNMEYGYLKYLGSLMSGAYTVSVSDAFVNYFRYPSAEYIDWSEYQSFIGDYYALIRKELDAGRPVFYEIGPGTTQSFGHAVVCDGYNDTYFHLNFGWQGANNGYYLLEGFQAADAYEFFMKGSSIIGLSPSCIKSNPADSLALVAIYNSLGGNSWTKKTGWLQQPLNQWYGVIVINGRVTKLELTQNNLFGLLFL